jgi:hypothetical protein
MPPPVTRTNFKFVPRVSFESAKKLAFADYNIALPAGLTGSDVPEPVFATKQKIESLLHTPSKIVSGLVTAKFSLSFANLVSQWKQLPQKSGPSKWQFQGGEVYLQSLIGLYLLEDRKPQKNDSRSRSIFRIIMEHELEHVLDDMEIVKTWLPAFAYKDDIVDRYLGQGQMMDDSMFQQFIKGPKLQAWLEGPWQDERNRRKNLRDSPQEYDRLQREFNTAS